MANKQIHDFARAIATAAVEDVLMRVCRDEHCKLEYRELIRLYRDSVVAEHASESSTAAAIGSSSQKSTTCGGMHPKTKKKCVKRAVLNGYCAAHAFTALESSSKTREVAMYQHAVTTKPPDRAASSMRDALSHVPGLILLKDSDKNDLL